MSSNSRIVIAVSRRVALCPTTVGVDTSRTEEDVCRSATGSTMWPRSAPTSTAMPTGTAAVFGAEVTFTMDKTPDHPRMFILDVGGGAALNVFEVSERGDHR